MRNRQALVGAATLAVLALATVLLAATTLLPAIEPRYYLMLPGESFPVGPRIHVPAERQAEIGDLSFTVVYEQAASLPDALRAATRYGVRVVPYEEIIPIGTTVEQSNESYRRSMRESHVAAIAVALRRAGFPVEATGEGVRVTGLIAGMPAVGRLETDDVIVAYNGSPIRTSVDLTEANRRVAPGDPVDLWVRRSGEERTVRIRTVPSPSDASRAAIGIYIQTAGFRTELPFQVEIEERTVGGPSAGLMFALGVYDAITPGRLGGGLRIAGTGSIDFEGRVGGVGGAIQKVLGAERGGADVFLSPADNYDETRAAAGKVRVVSVRTIDDALAALAELASENQARTAQIHP